MDHFPPPLVFREKSQEVVRRRIATFQERFGLPHLHFAQHAAFLLALTPDMLYRLWANFHQDIQAPWVVVADLLLSNLCDEVGYELYEIQPAARTLLLDGLKSTFGEARLRELAEFLLASIRQHMNEQEPGITRAQQWIALAYLKPGEAATELTAALQRSIELDDRTEQVYLSSLVETFAGPLADFVPLLVYAREIGQRAREDVEDVATEGVQLTEEDAIFSEELPSVPMDIFQYGQTQNTSKERQSESMPPLPMPLLPQKEIPAAGMLERRTFLHKRYMIMRTIGRGGMGAVYQARDMKRQGAIWAIKEMSLSMVPDEERDQAIQNFKTEAKMLWGLKHPNLPAFTGFFSENQRYFLVMEYIDGLTLEELLDRNKGPFSERVVLGWARQLCDVLEYLHSQHPPIIFRDMKPGNIMLTRSGHIKLIDFGIARFFRPNRDPMLDTPGFGTPGFAPPEQYGTAQTDERSDIYSLAMTLFQLLTDTFSENRFGLENIRAINPKISPVVARALEKAADARPERRYKNVAEFRSALLGVGFVFDSEDLAMDPQELAELCMRYPAEAADYLLAGEIEAWLHEIGQEHLAREAQRIRTTINDPQEAIESFIDIVPGQYAPTRSKKPARKSTNGSQNDARKTIPAHLANLRESKLSQPVQVNPSGLDFGQILTRSISTPLTLTISGNENISVSGIVYSNDGWIMLDQTAFDGVSTQINVRINSTKLYSLAHYAGIIMIVPDPDNAQKDIIVPVEVDIIDPQQSNAASKPSRKLRTASADLDAYDDDDDGFDAITLDGPKPQ